MLIDNQQIQIKWNNCTKKYYESLGYRYTKIGDVFTVKVLELLPNSSFGVDVICDECHQKFHTRMSYYTRSVERYGKYVCKKCAQNIRLKKSWTENAETQIEHFHEFCDCNGYVAISGVDNYKNAKGKLYYICPKHGEQNTTADRIRKGEKCRYCSQERIARLYTRDLSEVKDIVESKNNNKLINKGEYINTKTKNLRVKCGFCGKEFTTSLSSIMASEGACPECGIIKCSNSTRLDSSEVEIRINGVNNNKLLNPNEYRSIGTINLKIKCGDCGETFTTSLANYEFNKKIRCDKCSKRISKLEREVMEFLEKRCIDYEYNHTFEDCIDKSYLPFDFFIPDYNTIIEMDGPHHFEPIWGEEHFFTTLLHDGMKNNYCKWHNIKMIRIPYWDEGKINEILNEELLNKNNYKKIQYKFRKSLSN